MQTVKRGFGFLLLFGCILAYRETSGGGLAFLLATLSVIGFWFFHAMRFSLSNFRTVFILVLGFGLAVFVFQDQLPLPSSHGITGASNGFDLNPARIASLKTSHELAFELYLDHSPTEDDRYFKTASLKETDDGFHYQAKKTLMDLTKLPETVRWSHENLQGLDAREIAHRLEDSWKNQFRYSLDPGQLDETHPLDDFLFHQKRGFCEHFAAALTSLFQINKIQARVAVGFSGGSWNPISRILSFEMSDAHAWVEAWDAGKKQWIRFDPTRWVDPEAVQATTRHELPIFMGILAVFLATARVWKKRSHQNPKEKLLQELERYDQKNALPSLGFTIDERLARIQIRSPEKKDRVNRLRILYQEVYFESEPTPGSERALSTLDGTLD